MKKFQDIPYKKFLDYYHKALDKDQAQIEAAVLSSYNSILNEVNSRFVNIKYLRDDKFIFFSNYQSNKAEDISSHDQISLLFFWNKINVQIRIKAIIQQCNAKDSDNHFALRKKEKNILATISRQSFFLESYDSLLNDFNKLNNEGKSLIRPDYWVDMNANLIVLNFGRVQ